MSGFKEIKVKFKYNNDLNINNSKTKGIYYLEININYELFKFLVETKDEKLITIGKRKTKKGLFFDTNNENDKNILNKILNCKEFFVIKNIYVFDIVKQLKEYFSNDKKIAENNFIINNIKYLMQHSLVFSRKDIEIVFEILSKYYYNIKFDWKNSNINFGFFDIRKYNIKYSNNSIGELNAICKLTIEKYKNFFSRIFIK